MTIAAWTVIASWLIAGAHVASASQREVAAARARLWAGANTLAVLSLLLGADGTHVGAGLIVDVESLSFATVASLTTSLLMLATSRSELSRESAMRVLVWTAAALVVFFAQALWLLALGWMLGCIPLVLRRDAKKLSGMMNLLTVGVLPLLAAVIWSHMVGGTLDVRTLHLAGGTHGGILVLILIAVATRLGIAPFHGWVPTIAANNSLEARFLIVPLPAAYLLLHASAGFAQAFQADQPWLEGVTLASAIYFGLLAYARCEQWWSALYLALSQSSLIFMAICATEALTVEGGLVLLVSEVFAIGGLLSCAALVRSRRGDVGLQRFHGLGTDAPVLAGLSFVFGMATVGLPFSLTFVAEDLIAQGLLVPHPMLAMGFVAATAINAIGMVRHFGRTFWGAKSPVRCPDVRSIPRAALTILAIFVVIGGVAPQVGLMAVTGSHVEQVMHAAVR